MYQYDNLVQLYIKSYLYLLFTAAIELYYVLYPKFLTLSRCCILLEAKLVTLYGMNIGKILYLEGVPLLLIYLKLLYFSVFLFQ